MEKKLMAVRIVKHSFDIIHLLTDKNPIQVYVDAVKNGGPREDSTRIGSAGGFMSPWLCSANSPPSDTVIIFDWDDTLLCSSAINLQQWNASQLEELEIAIETVLIAAMRLGETLIVTNGNRCWVQDSSRRFLPRLTPLLNRLKVMSARAAYETSWPGDPFAWKKAAFHEILSDRQGKLDPAHATLNLIVLGDSLAEIEAAHSATQRIPGTSLVKTVKFKEMPSADELLGELRMVTQMLPQIVHQDSACGKALIPRPLSPHLDHLTACASSWQFTEHRMGCVLDLGPPVTLAGG
jgi:hypothetical protein